MGRLMCQEDKNAFAPNPNVKEGMKKYPVVFTLNLRFSEYPLLQVDPEIFNFSRFLNFTMKGGKSEINE